MRMTSLTVLATLMLAAASAVQAQVYSPSWQSQPHIVEDRFRIEVGVMQASLNTTARIDAGTDFVGTEFNAEQDFGLAKSKTLPLLELTLLPGKRHLLRFNALSIERSSAQIVTRDIDYDEETFNQGDLVDSFLNIRLFGLTYGYRLITHDRFEIDALLGIQALQISDNAQVRGKTTREPTGDTAPIPVLGVEARFDFTKRWSIEMRAQYFSATVQEVTGKLFDGRLAVTWRANPHMVVGLGYRRFGVNAESTNADSAGLVDFKINAPELFIRASL